MTDFDFSELEQLAADLGDVGENVGPNVSKAVTVSSINVKKAWQEPLKGSATLPLLPYAINFDVTVGHLFGKSVIASEIGFDKDKKQGQLGNISEYGTPTTPGRGFGIKALHDNEADFVRGLAIALEQAERAAGL